MKKKNAVASVKPSSTCKRESVGCGARLFIGLCCYGGVHPQFLISLIKFLALAGGYVYVVGGDSLVSRARNKVAAAFLASDKDILLQIDTDIAFDAARMWEMVCRNLDVAGGLYALKQPTLKWCLNSLDGSKFRPNKQGLCEVKYIGTGMLCVHRKVFNRLIELKMAEEFSADDGESVAGKMHDFFRVGVEVDSDLKKRRYMSEDWYFCEMARRAGFQVFADFNNKGKHYGEAIYQEK